MTQFKSSTHLLTFFVALCLLTFFAKDVKSQGWIDPPPKYQCPLDYEIYPCLCTKVRHIFFVILTVS